MNSSYFRKSRLNLHVGLAVLSAATMAPLAVWAQTAAPAPAAPTDSADKVPELVVTATRKSEKDLNVPVSTSIITPSQVQAIFSAGGDIRALAAEVPSLNIESSNGRTFPRLYIRGYGNTDFTSFASQPVSLVYDDVDQENPALKGFPIFDVTDIEVDAGPQGTLFGRNAPAGVVSIKSAPPQLGQFGETLSISDGTYNTANFNGVLNAPIGDTSAVRISLQEQHRDNWVRDPINDTNLEGYDDFAGRIQYLYQPNDNFSALFNFHGRDLSGSARLFRANSIEYGTDNLVPGFNPATIYTDGKNTQTFASVGGNAHLTWNLGSVTLYSITGLERILNYFTQGDIDGGYGASYESTQGPTEPGPIVNGQPTVIGIPFSVETAGGISSHLQLTQEFRAASNYSGPINWQGGVYIFYERVTAPDFDYDQYGNYVTDDNYSRQMNDAEAVFGSVDYKPTDKLTFRVGGRVTEDYKKFAVISAYNQTFANTVDKATGGNFSWDASGTYNVIHDFNVYARVATGFRAPSFGAPSATQPIQVARAETNTSYEIGEKAFLFDHKVKLNFDIYYFDVKDQQLTAVGGVVNETLLLNAKNTIGDGAELTFEARLAPHLTVGLAASYNFTKIEDPNISVATCATGDQLGAYCNVTNPINAQGNAIINGNPLPQAPKYVVDPTLSYTYPLSEGELFFFGDVAYRSQINFLLYEAKEFTGQALTNVGLRGGYRWNNDKYEVAAYCRNCLNEIRTVGAIDFDNLTGFINDPVIYGVQFSGKF
jgi:iron complex outermembrane receptor protein